MDNMLDRLRKQLSEAHRKQVSAESLADRLKAERDLYKTAFEKLANPRILFRSMPLDAKKFLDNSSDPHES